MPLDKLPLPGTPQAWLRYAKADLALAKVQPPPEVTPNLLCFHTQQCVERAIKAVLIFRGIPFPKTHNIRFLVDLLPKGLSYPTAVEQSTVLSKYAVQLRYPEDEDEIRREHLEYAIALAEQVLRWSEQTIQQTLPSS